MAVFFEDGGRNRTATSYKYNFARPQGPQSVDHPPSCNCSHRKGGRFVGAQMRVALTASGKGHTEARRSSGLCDRDA